MAKKEPYVTKIAHNFSQCLGVVKLGVFTKCLVWGSVFSEGELGPRRFMYCARDENGKQ